MQKHFFLLLLSFALFQSCTKDLGTIEMTYTKATAIYGDLDEVRSTPILETARTIQNPGKIFVSNDFLLIGEEGKGIHVFDNSDLSNPTPVSFLNIPGNHEFYVQGDMLFAESYYDMIKVDLSNLAQPQISDRVEFAFSEPFVDDKGRTLIGFDFEKITEEIKLDSEIAQTPWGDQDYYYFDYAQRLIPPSSVPASFAGSNGNAIGSVNRIAYMNDYVYVVSRSNLTAFDASNGLELLSSNNVGWEMETIFPEDNRLFVGARNSMTIFDASNPSEPRMASSFFHEDSCDPVYPDGDIAYLTLRTGDFSDCPGNQNALLVLDISNDNIAMQIDEIRMKRPYGLSLIGDKLYVGEGEFGLKIFDATDRKKLKLTKFDESIEAYDVIPHPTRNDLILVAGTNGLQQYEVEGDDFRLLSQISY